METRILVEMKIVGKNVFHGKQSTSILLSMKIKMMDDFSALDFFRFASRMTQIAQITD